MKAAKRKTQAPAKSILSRLLEKWKTEDEQLIGFNELIDDPAYPSYDPVLGWRSARRPRKG